MSLVERHLGFLSALREAGLAVSLAEGRDAVSALGALGLAQRSMVREAYAATVVKRASQRPTFDAIFDVWFPALVGSGTSYAPDSLVADSDDVALGDEQEVEAERVPVVRDNGEALRDLREQLADALGSGDEQAMAQLAVEAVERFGAMPGRGPGLSSWSAYTALQRVSPSELIGQIVQGLRATGRTEEEAQRVARTRVADFTSRAESDARRRIAEEKGAAHVTRATLRPPIDRIDFTSARRTDLEQMRRQIAPLARRMATRMTKEQHANRRGPLDFRRTVRASLSTGGVPLATHHRPKRPHRTELVVLCDVSGSVANFASFTLMLMFAMREQFTKVRAFTFIDQAHEVTQHFRSGADPGDVLTALAADTAQAARWGRTNYGRAFSTFSDKYGDALGPTSSLLILGDARSNHSELAASKLRGMADAARHSWWLNPEHRRNWDTGDSAASRYAAIVPMVECRNLTQLGEFVHDLV